MKKIALIIIIGFSMFSCDYILKKDTPEDTSTEDPKKVVLGIDKDENGCVGSAGYSWSVLLQKCIRPFEEGLRLNPIVTPKVVGDTIEQIEAEETVFSAFAVFGEDQDKVEIYLPSTKGSMILERDSKDKIYKKGDWTLETSKPILLKQGGTILYRGAESIDKKEIGDDNVEN
ncbi:hypothetical protein [Flavobacterium kingsejongi]|uniref:Lipoprotein n=1 Tax=Flavobacterium kingsejongi TaxID=1678728 RepID=A0A2S1LSN4_9FLAO|nr:hypothetical protein [Flavobacterium kingsejongi]AWG26698.1 hypothetical protein FK004_16420 [Flavobacterium kingsejongi]